MSARVRALFLIGLTSLMVLPFHNCGKYAEPASEDLFSESLSECDDDCIAPKPENLSIKVNIGSGNQYDVPSGLSEWNLGGDCNEGGFPSNVIRWELILNGVVVRNSGMSGMRNYSSVHGRCINGRFLLYINLSSIPQDPVNRSGLMYGNGVLRTSYELNVEIYGQRMVNDPAPVRNGTKGRTRISLSAI